MINGVDKLRRRSHQDRDVVGEVLGSAETLESVSGEILVGMAG
jgi:hypothetical protein